MYNFACLVDIIQYLNDVNMDVQEKDHFIHNVFDKFKAFKNKHQIFNYHVLSNNSAHFPFLRKETLLDTRKHAQEIQYNIFTIGYAFNANYDIFGSNVCEQLFSAITSMIPL